MKYLSKKHFLLLGWGGLLLGYLLVITVFVWLVYPYKTIYFKQPFKVLNSPVKSGTDMYIQIDYCKYTTEIPTVTSHFIDGIAYDVPTKAVSAKGVGCGVTTITENVPDHLPLGKGYQLQRVYSYHPNPLRTINVVTYTEPFDVIK
jgi:hypothetical protein